MCLELCETPPPGKGGRDCYISLFAPHATPTSHRNVPLLAKWEIAYRSSELDITVYVQSAGQTLSCLLKPGHSLAHNSRHDH